MKKISLLKKRSWILAAALLLQMAALAHLGPVRADTVEPGAISVLPSTDFEEGTPGEAIPAATMKVAGATPAADFTYTYSDEYVASGGVSAKLSRNGYKRAAAENDNDTYILLDIGKMDEDFDPQSIENIIFHVKLPHGVANEEENALGVQLEIAGNSWWNNSKLFALRDGGDAWTELTEKSDGANANAFVLPGGFEGYIKVRIEDITNMFAESDNLADHKDYMKDYATKVLVMVDEIGTTGENDAGPLYVDTFMIGLEDADNGITFLDAVNDNRYYAGFDPGSIRILPMNSFEGGTAGEAIPALQVAMTGAATSGFTYAYADSHTAHGTKAAAFNREEFHLTTAANDNTTAVTFDYTRIPADFDHTLIESFIFHVTMPAAVEPAGQNALAPEIEIAGNSWWGASKLFLLQDGDTSWTEVSERSEGGNTRAFMLPEGFEGFVKMRVADIGNLFSDAELVDNMQYLLPYTCKLLLGVDQIGGAAGSLYVDALMLGLQDSSEGTTFLDATNNNVYYAGDMKKVESTLSSSLASRVRIGRDTITSANISAGKFKSYLSTNASQTFKLTLADGTTEPADSAPMAEGMLVKVFAGSELLKTYEVASVFVEQLTSTLQSLIPTSVSISGTSITAVECTVAQLRGRLSIDPTQTFTIVKSNDAPAADTDAVAVGMKVKVYYEQDTLVETYTVSKVNPKPDYLTNIDPQKQFGVIPVKDFEEGTLDAAIPQSSVFPHTRYSAAPLDLITQKYSNKFNGDGSLCAEIDSSMWVDNTSGYGQVFFFALDDLPADISPSDPKSVIFYVKMPKEAVNSNAMPNYLRFGFELAPKDDPEDDEKWIWFETVEDDTATGSKAPKTIQLLEAGSTEWTEVKNGEHMHNRFPIKGGYEGFIKVPIDQFISLMGTPLSTDMIFSPDYLKRFYFHIQEFGGGSDNKLGQEDLMSGPLYVDSFMIALNESKTARTFLDVTDKEAPSYFAGETEAPTKGIITPKNRRIQVAGADLFVRVMKVRDFADNVTVEAGQTIVIKNPDRTPASPDAQIAEGMIVEVYDGDTKLSEYKVKRVNPMPDTAECSILQADFSLATRLKITGTDIFTWSMTVAEVRDWIIVPDGKSITFLDGERVVGEDELITQGMRIKCYIEGDPDMFQFFTFKEVKALNLEGGYGLTAKNGDITIVIKDGTGTIIAPSNMTVKRLLESINLKDDDIGEVHRLIDGEYQRLEDDELLREGDVLFIIDGISFDILSQYGIQLGNPSPNTGVGIGYSALMMAAPAMGGLLLMRKKKTKKS